MHSFLPIKLVSFFYYRRKEKILPSVLPGWSKPPGFEFWFQHSIMGFCIYIRKFGSPESGSGPAEVNSLVMIHITGNFGLQSASTYGFIQQRFCYLNLNNWAKYTVTMENKVDYKDQHSSSLLSLLWLDIIRQWYIILNFINVIRTVMSCCCLCYVVMLMDFCCWPYRCTST